MTAGSGLAVFLRVKPTTLCHILVILGFHVVINPRLKVPAMYLFEKALLQPNSRSKAFAEHPVETSCVGRSSSESEIPWQHATISRSFYSSAFDESQTPEGRWGLNHQSPHASSFLQSCTVVLFNPSARNFLSSTIPKCWTED